MSALSRLPVFLFATAIFLGAFLLFLVQPMLGKRILAWFGGGPGVWMVCLMFYQVTLFLGYLYAHALVRFMGTRPQWLTHVFVLCGALLVLPVLPTQPWRPDPNDDPSRAIVFLLLANVFLPFLALAATGPLLQTWFARGYPGRSPYPLYAVSNMGSFLALMLFPTVVEPFFFLDQAGDLWSLGFVMVAILILIAGGLAVRSNAEPAARMERGPEGGGRIAGKVDNWLWILLSACAVILLMGITNVLCLDMFNIPFLWVLPLGLYLLSFIVCFSSERAYHRGLWTFLALAALSAEYWLPSWLAEAIGFKDMLGGVLAQVSLMGLILFALCMLLHGELFRMRPPIRSLTSFYLAIAGGGALAGLFVGGLAPRVFNDYYELAAGYGLALLLLLFVFARDPQGWMVRRGSRWVACAVAALIAGYSLPIALRDPSGLIHKERSFFGVVRVVEWAEDDAKLSRRVLRHGTTVHGAQLLAEELRQRPISYYGYPTGIGMLMQQRQRTPGISSHVGVLGLGAGSLAAYGRAGDFFSFYEIDPVVIAAAGKSGYFTYLEESQAQIEVVAGDARSSLQRELDLGGSRLFDILVVDTFSSDSIPVHMLTQEAMELFIRHLSPDGLLAFHLSSRYFDLESIVYRLGSEFGLSMLTVQNGSAGIKLGTASVWIFLSPNPRAIASLRGFVEERRRSAGVNSSQIVVRDSPRLGYARAPVWTDDYNSLLGLMFRSAR